MHVDKERVKASVARMDAAVTGAWTRLQTGYDDVLGCYQSARYAERYTVAGSYREVAMMAWCRAMLAETEKEATGHASEAGQDETLTVLAAAGQWDRPTAEYQFRKG